MMNTNAKHPRARLHHLIYAASLLFVLCTLPVVSRAESFEPRLIESLNALQYGSDNISEDRLSSLIEDYPNSQTAHLLMADLLLARAGIVDSNQVRSSYSDPEALRQLDGLRDEVRIRWNQMAQPGPAEQGLVPASVVQLAANRPTVVFVDAENSRIYTFENTAGKLILKSDNYTSIGEKGMHKRREGDERTPIGVYHVTRYIEQKDLPPRYGAGAFPINYPNELDRHYKRSGYGIWIHGTHPDSYNRVPLASDGCVAMSNPEFEQIKPLINPKQKTTVIISDHPNWIKAEHLARTRAFLHSQLQQWARDWESLDTGRYLSHYDKHDFFSPGGDFQHWAKRKTAINAGKSRIDVELSDISLFAYPGEQDLVVAEFTQNYQSDKFNSETQKRQYWRRNANNEWKILYEGPQN